MNEKLLFSVMIRRLPPSPSHKSGHFPSQPLMRSIFKTFELRSEKNGPDGDDAVADNDDDDAIDDGPDDDDAVDDDDGPDDGHGQLRHPQSPGCRAQH